MTSSSAARLVAAIVALAPLVSVAAPGPAPVSSSRPLQEIGHVHATTEFCKTALDRATLGATIAFDDDAKLAETQAFLRRVDLDSSDLARVNGSRELNRRYVSYRAAAAAGVAEMKALRELAAKAPTAEQKQGLIAFADALAGVLDRQRKLADAVGRLVVYIDNHGPIDKDERVQSNFAPVGPPTGPTFADAALSLVAPKLNPIAEQGAAELDIRAEPVKGDEDAAAAKIDAAFGAC